MRNICAADKRHEERGLLRRPALGLLCLTRHDGKTQCRLARLLLLVSVSVCACEGEGRVNRIQEVKWGGIESDLRFGLVSSSRGARNLAGERTKARSQKDMDDGGLLCLGRSFACQWLLSVLCVVVGQYLRALVATVFLAWIQWSFLAARNTNKNRQF
jgi:hypothetical protein